MSIKESIRLLILLTLFINISHCKSLSDEASDDADKEIDRQRRVVGPRTAFKLALSVASAIQKAVCTFSDVCGGNEVTKKLEELEKKLNALQSDVTSVRNDVEDIWDASKRKWYFKHIDNIIQQRKEVMYDLAIEDYSQLAKDKQDRFVLEVFGTTAKDEYVEKALLHIPDLIVKEGLVTHYHDVQIRNGKSSTEATRLTWIFIRKLFRYQIDGYATMVFAASIKYKKHPLSFNRTMAEVCSYWTKTNDLAYEDICDKYLRQFPGSFNRRKYQQDYIFNFPNLALLPVQLVQTDCNQFKDANAIHYSTGYMYVAHPAGKKISVVDPKTLRIVKTLSIPGSLCGGNCHPYGVSVKAKHMLLAVAAKTSLSGGQSKILLFKISGNLENPLEITIQHYYTNSKLIDVNRKKADVRDIAFCGNRLGYADYNGVTRTWRMPDENYNGWNNGKPVPDLWDRHDWSLNRVVNTFKDNQYYLGCSNDGKYWAVEKTKYGSASSKIGALLSSSRNGGGDVFSQIAFKMFPEDMYNGDQISRMNTMKGIAIDCKKNLFYSSEKYFSNARSGIHQRLSDGNIHYIREWETGIRVEMFGMAADENGYLFSIEKQPRSSRCLYKFYHEIDLEDIKV